MPGRSLFLWLGLRAASDSQFGGARATACAGKGRRPHPRCCEPPFEILAGSNHESLTVDAPEPPQAKASHAVPLLAFRKQGFHPDLALVQSFLVGQGLLVALDPFHVVGKKGAVDAAAARTFRTLRFHRTDLADRGVGAVLHLLDPFQAERRSQYLALGTAIQILVGIIGKLCQSIIAHVVLPSLSDGDVGPNAGLFDGFEVLSRSIQAISSDLPGPQMPSKAGMPSKVR